MKKSTVFIIAVITAAMVLMMTACGKSEFSCDASDSKNIVITAQNASADSFFMSGSLEVAEGEEIVVEPALEKGEIVIAMNINPEEQSIEALPDWEGEPTLEFTVSGSEPQTFEAQPGSYNISATVTEKATGSVVIRTQSAEGPEKWNTAASLEEAAEAAGLGSFSILPDVTSLGAVTNSDFRYMEGVAEGHYGVAAVDLYVRKGLASIDEGDISFDNTEYKYNWTQNIKGLVVNCFGNREGEATKIIWTIDDYSYAICAYGAGGDTDFGLSADDINSLINSIP